VKVDLIFDKGGFNGQDIMVLNPSFVHQIAASKLETYRHFGKYQPKTVLCASREETVKAAAEMPGDLIVVKEPDEYVNGTSSNGGKFVYIGSREKVLAELPERYPVMVQEFVDTSIGIENLADGVHDVRVEIGGGEIWGGTLRMPAPGELKANVAQGGTRRRLFADEIPAEAKKIALEIDHYFAKYPRHYSIDFAHTTHGWKLIELNNNPGLSPIDLSPQAKYITEKLADYLTTLCPSR
jgi:glutathione synthase/RimK-type ligase-like ATP-grasp enzyme